MKTPSNEEHIKPIREAVIDYWQYAARCVETAEGAQ